MAFDLSTTNRKAVRQIHNFTTSRRACCTTNPQQIEQVEFELQRDGLMYRKFPNSHTLLALSPIVMQMQNFFNMDLQ
jgi:hypothetical protein